MGERVDVEAASGHIGGNQQFRGPISEATDHAFALGLIHTTVECLGAVATAVHRLRELINLTASAAEHQRRAGCLDVENPTQSSRFMRTHHHICALANKGLTGLGVALADLDPDWVTLVALGDRVDPRRQRGREQHGLARRGCRIENRFDVVGEPHVEHLIGLIKDYDLDIIEWQRAAANVVDRPSGRGDNDVDAAIELLKLPVDRLAAVDRHDLDTQPPSVLEDRLADLHGKLTRRHEDQGDRFGWKTGVDEFEYGQRERCGLAGTRRRLTEQVASGDQERDCLALYRGRLLVPEIVECLQRLRS